MSQKEESRFEENRGIYSIGGSGLYDQVVHLGDYKHV